MRRRVSRREYQPAYTHLLCQSVKCFALHKLASGISKESLPFSGEVSVNDVAHDGVEYGVAQEFKSFVVHRFAICTSSHHTLVHQGKLIVANVSRIEPKNLK
jgi:hypothetical protein